MAKKENSRERPRKWDVHDHVNGSHGDPADIQEGYRRVNLAAM